MYNEHFGLTQAPFRITPDTRLFFSGGGRGDILDALVYAISSGEGIVKVVGEVGSGKTMLCRMLEERLPDNVEIVYLANPSLSPDHILQAIAMEMSLEVPGNANRLQVMHALQQRLLEKHAGNRQVVIFVEEAQSMPIDTLEEIRLLSNLETQREKLLQIVLFGQPELDEKLDQENIRQLRERITHSFNLQPLSKGELRDYVRFRMRAVGYRGADVFRPGAYRGLARASEGLTRRINILADKSLLAAFADDCHEVNRKHVHKAIGDSRFERRKRNLAPGATLVLGITMILGATAWTVLQRGQRPAPEVAAGAPSESVAAAPGSADTRGPEPGRLNAEAPPAATTTAAPVAPPNPAPSGASSATVVTRAPAPQAGPADDPGQFPGSDTRARIASVAENIPRTDAEAASAGSVIASVKEQDVADAKADVTSAAENGGHLRSAAGPPADREPALPAEDRTAVLQEPAAAAQSTETRTRAAPVALLERRMEVTRHWLQETNEAHFSIQLMLTARSQRPHLEAFLEEQARRDGLRHVYVYETVINDRPYIGVLYGEFPTLTAAREALEKLPAALKRLGPFIRNVRDISTVG